MKPKTMALAVVAVICGLVASYLTNQLLAQRNAGPAEEPTVKVLVAKVKISPYMPIKEPEKVFDQVEYPERLAPKKAIHDFEKIKDQRLNKLLDAEKLVTEEDLLNKESQTLVAAMKPGERAVAIKVNPETLVGGFVLPGSRVDVVCTIRGTDTSSQIILQDMLVLAVDTQSARTDQQSILGQTVTVSAKPEEATRLTLASSVGELRLVLRGLGDNKTLGPVVSRVADLGKPMLSDSSEGRTESSSDERKSVMVAPVGTLPALPPEESKPEPTKPDAPAKPTPEVAEKKPSRIFTMKITNGSNTEKARFNLDDLEEPGDDDAPARPETKPVEKKAVEPARTPQAPIVPVPPTGKLRAGKI